MARRRDRSGGTEPSAATLQKHSIMGEEMILKVTTLITITLVSILAGLVFGWNVAKYVSF